MIKPAMFYYGKTMHAADIRKLIQKYGQPVYNTCLLIEKEDWDADDTLDIRKKLPVPCLFDCT